MAKLLEKLSKTKLSGEKTKLIVGNGLRKLFDAALNEDQCEEILVVAWNLQVPQIDEMINDYLTHFGS